MKYTKRTRLQRGFSMTPIVSFAVGFGLIGLGLMSMTTTMNRTAQMTGDKWQATSLAESAVNMFYDQIRMQMISDQNFPFSMNDTIIYPNGDSTKPRIGVVSAKIIANREVQNDLEIDGRKIRRFTYYYTIEGTGKAIGNVESVVQAKFTATVDRDIVRRETVHTGYNADPSEFHFPVGAMVSNEKIDIHVNGGFRTTSVSGDDAHVIANDGIDWNTVGGSKKFNTTPDVLSAKGQFLVPQGGPYDRTISPTGMGNFDGTKNYRNPAAPANGDFPGSPANSVLRMPGEVEFADEDTVDDWADDWRSKGQSGPTPYPGNTTSASIPNRPADGWKVIKTPAYINGDLEVSNGTQIRLLPNSTNPRDNVVYVKGNIKNYGQLLNLGVTVVVEGKYMDDSDAQYKIDQNGSPFDSREMVLMRSALISLNKSQDAITITSNQSYAPGLVYAAKGGIEVTGANVTLTGLLLAGGRDGQGGIDIHPAGGAGFTLNYEAYAATGGELPADQETTIDVDYVPGGISRPFQPVKLFQWIRKK